MTVEGPTSVAAPAKAQDASSNSSQTSQEQKKSSGNPMDTIISSLARKRRTSGVFGSKRWWQPSCWASRSHQEAYLRKLYSKKYSNGVANPAVTTNDELPASGNASGNSSGAESGNPWKAPVYELPTTDEHYLDAFLRGRTESECPALSTPRASPTEKCVEFLSRNEARSRECIIDIHPEQHQQQPQHQQQQKGVLKVTERNFDDILRNKPSNATLE